MIVCLCDRCALFVACCSLLFAVCVFVACCLLCDVCRRCLLFVGC